MKAAALLMLLFTVSSYGEIKVLGNCEFDYKRCMFHCKAKFPIDESKYAGCKTRCKVDMAICKSKETVEKTYEGFRDFLSGFTEGKE